MQKTIRDRISAVSLLCKSSHLCVVTSVLPLNIIKFFPSLSARAAAHFGCMVGRYFLVMPKTRWNISLNGEHFTPGRQKVDPRVKCSGFNFTRESDSPVRSLATSAKRELSTIGRTGRCPVTGFVYGNCIILPTDGNAIVFAVWEFQHIKNVIKDKTKRKKGDKKYVQSNLQRNLPGLRSGDD